jgi:hypothetical protein
LLNTHTDHLFRTDDLSVGYELCTAAKNRDRHGTEQREQYPVAKWQPGLHTAAARLIWPSRNGIGDGGSLRANL